MGKKVFISYDNDKHCKNLLVAWDANKKFNFSFFVTHQWMSPLMKIIYIFHEI